MEQPMIRLDFLKTVDVFNNLNDDQLSLLGQGCREKVYRNGDLLFKDGEDASQIWIVQEGRVDLRFDLPARETSEVTTFYSEWSGSTFGWSCFVPPFQYILSAYCASRECRVLQLDKEYLLALFEEDARMGYTLMTNITRVIRTRFQMMQCTYSFRMTKIIVHMATCGIAAGAKEVMKALMIERANIERDNIIVESSGCIGRCESEPHVTVQKEGEEPVIYQHVTPNKMRLIFQQHVLKGKILSDFVLSE
jgi:NADP-reducing hydrogenase subunit HndB